MRVPLNVEQAIESLRQIKEGRESTAEISRKRAGPAKLLMLGYLSYIVVGWILLCLPWAQEGEPIAVLDNLFIAVSAVSTTGLITVDPGTSYTFLGELVILLLIQFGGLGYMTMSSFAFLAIQARLSNTQEETARTAFALPANMTPAFFIRSVVYFTFATEFVGAVCLYPIFLAEDVAQPLWSAVFHSISAFCTAGFSLNVNSFEAFSDHVGINVVISALSILGAMGFIIVADAARRVIGRASHFGFTSKVIFRMTGILIGFGTLLIFLAEPTVRALPPADRLLAAFFQAMSASTTVGFNTLPIGSLSNAVIMVLLVLMVIGASPSGTGGGMKTTSFAALVALVRSTLKGRDSVRFFKRRVPETQLNLAATTLFCYLACLSIALFVLFLTETGVAFNVMAFEAISALGTVGLSMGATGDLSEIGKLTIIALMIIGRLGVLTFGLALAVPDETLEEERDNELVM
ncbi:potassium uptake protein KtrB [Fulvimarina pelagi HTCC2506]|uniref:Potassium uptake protein KtrB n=1 Tax=Fulvimarina pelagi HTCC2506 TaxID=314231 RepID=Q0FYS7_9HYPH|nr:potassium transporter TrkG [Fulvimarina pelagi]EAU40231.1 potassium uptake protein KtrB [Fulvimarina pelagi HTCC2506]